MSSRQNPLMMDPQAYQQLLQIQRQQALAKALTDEGMTPINPVQSSGRYVVPVSPWQGAAKIGQAIAGNVIADRAAKQEGQLAATQQESLNGALSRALGGDQAPSGPPVAPQPDMQQAAPQADVPRGTGQLSAQDYRILAQYAPEVLKSRMDLQNAGPLAEARAGAEAKYRAAPSEIQEYKFAKDQGYTKSFNDFRLEKARAGSTGGNPFFQFLPTPEGYFAGNARTGQASPVSFQNNPVKPAQYDPQTHGQIKRAEATGTAVGTAEGGLEKRSVTAPNTLDLLDRAEKLIPQSTHSGVGQMADKAAAMVGKSTPGAEAGDQLRAIAGALTSQVPRMEGPQSDRDTQLYKEQAGDLGNTAIPVERRLAALKTLRELTRKYANAGSQPSGIKFLGFE